MDLSDPSLAMDNSTLEESIFRSLESSLFTNCNCEGNRIIAVKLKHLEANAKARTRESIAISKKLKQILEILNPRPDESIYWPINTMEEMAVVRVRIEDPEFRSKLLIDLGSQFDTMRQRVAKFRSFFSDRVIQKYNSDGRLGKRSFRSEKVFDLVFEAWENALFRRDDFRRFMDRATKRANYHRNIVKAEIAMESDEMETDPSN